MALDIAAVFEESPLWTSMAAGPIARALARVGRWDDGLAIAADAVAQGGDRGLLYLAWLTIAFVAAERAEPPLDVEVVRAGLADIELYPTTALLCLAYLDVAEGRHERARTHLAAAWDQDRAFRPLQPAAVDARPEGRARLARRRRGGGDRRQRAARRARRRRRMAGGAAERPAHEGRRARRSRRRRAAPSSWPPSTSSPSSWPAPSPLAAR